MGSRKSICQLLENAARRSRSSMAMPNSVKIPPAEKLCLSSGEMNSKGQSSLVRFLGDVSRGGVLSTEGVAPGSWNRIAGIHVGRTLSAVEPTFGVGPVRGADRDPKSKGDTPDDFRADYIHMVEPKEITKEKAAAAQEEPPDLQVRKLMPQFGKPIVEEADAQRAPGDKVFESNTRIQKGTAQKQGDTTGNESGDKVEGQYGAGSSEGTTSRA